MTGKIETALALMDSMIRSGEDHSHMSKATLLEAKDNLSQLRLERDALAAVCEEFIDKVDRGEARSTKTYADMKKRWGLMND